MAGNYNRIVLVGNLTRDPEIRYVQSGSAVTKFSIAVNRHTKNGDDTTFVDIVAWDNGNYKLAETCNTYLKKGSSVLVEGRLVIRSYEDREGTKRKATEVVIDTMQMLDRAPAGTSRENGDGAAYDKVRPISKSAPVDDYEPDESDASSEIPF
jgi:single-strand DNA-binding protein